MKLSEFNARVLKHSTVKAALDTQQAALPPKQGSSADDVRLALEFFAGTLVTAMSDIVRPATDMKKDHEVPKESEVRIDPSDFRFIKGLEALNGNARLVRLRCHFIEESIRMFVVSMPLFTRAKDIERRLCDLAAAIIPVAVSIRGVQMKPEYKTATSPRR